MSKCPKCGEEIGYLKYSEEKSFDFRLEHGHPVYDEIDISPSNDYCCPECDEVVFHGREDAINFLKGG